MFKNEGIAQINSREMQHFSKADLYGFLRNIRCVFVSPFDDLFCGSDEIDELLFQADVDGNGTIDYIEFITATMHMNRMEREDHLYKAFEYFDKDKSGYLLLLLYHFVLLWIHPPPLYLYVNIGLSCVYI